MIFNESGEVSRPGMANSLPQMNVEIMIRIIRMLLKNLMRTDAFSHIQSLVRTCASQVRDQSFCTACEARFRHEKHNSTKLSANNDRWQLPRVNSYAHVRCPAVLC